MKNIIILLSLAFFCAGCNSKTDNLKPAFTGASGELLVVCSNAYWNGSGGDSLRSWLQPDFPMLPQAEAMFNLLHVTETNLNSLLRRHRNVLHIQEKKEGTVAFGMIPEKNSKGQLYFILSGHSKNMITDTLRENYGGIIRKIRSEERQRIAARYARRISKEAQKSIQDFNIKMTVPEGFKVIDKQDNFLRLERRRYKKLNGTTHYIDQGLVIYQYPYKEDAILTANGLVKMRNEFVKKIPGPDKNTFMTTQNLPVEINNETLGGMFSVEMRGLWRIKDVFLGGPFISFSVITPDGRNLLTVEGYVMALKFNKREYIKELESIIQSLQFIEKKTAKKEVE